ncbi:hypothetical protein [Halobaculum litoreum]|nr:hypothetical protein [Halobaculum sp. DT92]
MAEQSDDERYGDDDVDTSHLDDLEDGCGCAEVWEHLSEEAEEPAADAE